MVLKLREDLKSVYDEIASNALSGTVMILVSNNCDSMAACRILVVSGMIVGPVAAGSNPVLRPSGVQLRRCLQEDQ